MSIILPPPHITLSNNFYFATLGKGEGGDELDEEAAILLGDLEDIGSLESGESAPVISRATSESNSRLTSPASVEVCGVCVCVCVYVCVCVWV